MSRKFLIYTKPGTVPPHIPHRPAVGISAPNMGGIHEMTEAMRIRGKDRREVGTVRHQETIQDCALCIHQNHRTHSGQQVTHSLGPVLISTQAAQACQGLPPPGALTHAAPARPQPRCLRLACHVQHSRNDGAQGITARPPPPARGCRWTGAVAPAGLLVFSAARAPRALEGEVRELSRRGGHCASIARQFQGGVS